MKRFDARSAAIAAVLVIACTGAARADSPRVEVDVAASAFGFTSPNGVVGPWTVENVQFREWSGADTIGISVANRIDADAGHFAHAQNIVFDDYHDWSPSFFTYAAISAGTGAPFASNSTYIEGDQKLLTSKRLVFALGVDSTRNADGTSEHFLNVGPTYYWPGFNATLRYLPITGASGQRSSSVLAAMTAGFEGRATTTLTLQSGAANPVLGAGALPTLAGEHTIAAQLDYKRWVGSSGGLTASAVFAHLTRSDTGALLYVQRGVSLGAFATFGRR